MTWTAAPLGAVTFLLLLATIAIIGRRENGDWHTAFTPNTTRQRCDNPEPHDHHWWWNGQQRPDDEKECVGTTENDLDTSDPFVFTTPEAVQRGRHRRR